MTSPTTPKAPLAKTPPPKSLARLAIVVPCFNEQEVLPETLKRLKLLLGDLAARGKVSADSGVWFVDDGSWDTTWAQIAEAAQDDARFHGVRLSRNRGHQNALLAGLRAAQGDAVVSIDADLQDDLSVIEKMVDLFAAGIDIVYGVRTSREVDTFFKRLTAEGYYHVLRRMGVQVVFNHADYRLMSRRALDALEAYSEVNLFVRGIIPQLGFTTATVGYERAERHAGESKYPLRKMLALALNGITSFSVVPLRMIAGLGLAVCLFSILMIGWVVFGTLVMRSVVPGWASSVIPTYFLGGVQLFSIGVIGEYVGKIYLETKRRPLFFVQEEV
jgi:glycosyltransferase involved in cell wall biosynthesis